MIIMGVDLGHARTGIAVCDKREILASPVKVITAYTNEKVAAEVTALAKELRAEKIVVGLPKNMDGTVGPRAEKCETLAKELEERTGLHVVLWDERRTTVAAHEILHRSGKKEKKHRQNVDAVAATLILQGYLDFKRRQ